MILLERKFYMPIPKTLAASMISAAILATTVTTAIPTIQADAKTTVKAKVKQGKTSRLGRIKTAKAIIYPTPTATKGTTSAKQLHLTFYINKKAIYKDTAYFLISNYKDPSKPTVGWVKSKDITTRTHTIAKNSTTKRYVKGNGKAYTRPWGDERNVMFTTLTKDKNTLFQPKTTEKVGNDVWYSGKLNGQTVWLKYNQVTTTKPTTSVPKPETPKPTEPPKTEEPTKPTEPTKPVEPPKEDPSFETTAVEKIGSLKSTAKIYQDPTKLVDAELGSSYSNENFYVYKKTTIKSKTYYQISRDSKPIGWVEEGQLNLKNITSSSTTSLKLYLTGFGSAYNISDGDTNNVVHKDLDAYRAKAFTAKKVEVVNGKTYYQGSIGGKTVWINLEQTGNNYIAENLRKTSNITQSEMQNYLIKKKGAAITSATLYKMIPAFLEVQKEYGISAQFMFAHAIVETGWGSSQISQYKNNFFGYQAYDSAPFTCALYFPTAKEGLAYYADRIYDKYLRVGGIYNHGVNVAGMNVSYATDKNWGRTITRIMEEMKPYSASYYAAQPISTIVPAPVNKTYDHIIPANMPQPSIFKTFDKGIKATTNASTKVYSMPYAQSTRQLGILASGKSIKLLGHNSDVKDIKDSNGKFKARWFRIQYTDANGQATDQAWVSSESLDILNLAVTNGDGCNVRDKPTTKDSKILTKLNDETYFKLVLDSKNKPVTEKDESNTTWYQLYIPGTTTKAWISSTIITKF